MATPKNVYELAQERLDVIFREFDTICVSFSGGKDSGVLLNLCIDYIRRNRLNRKLCVPELQLRYQLRILLQEFRFLYGYARCSWKPDRKP